MVVLNRNDILKANDSLKQLVKVPEWGGEIWVRGMTGAERDKLEASVVQQRGKDTNVNMTNIRAKIASMTICDENGKRLFKEEDIQALSQKSAAALQRVFVIGQKLSGLGDDDIQELTEALEENPLGDSPSD